MKEGIGVKINLPVILLRKDFLFPSGEIRLEFGAEDSKNIIEISEYFHQNKIFVITAKDPLEKNIQLKELPKIGTIAKIKHKLVLPNGKIRVLITGEQRAKAIDYIGQDEFNLESIIEPMIEEEFDSQKEILFLRKLIREVEDFLHKIPYMSNSMLSSLRQVRSLSLATDITCSNLSISSDRKREYLEENSPLKRLEMILEDIYKQKEMYELEKELDNKVKAKMDQNQKEFFIKEKIDVLQKELGITTVRQEEIEKIKKQNKDHLPQNIKKRLEKEILRYESMPELSLELPSQRNYIDALLQIPWNIQTEDFDDLSKVKEILDKQEYGLEPIKMRILEYLAVKKKNPEGKSPILCFVGPPGTGKTSFAFHLATALKKNFVKISLGGINDAAEIVGHRRTYLGANPGRIAKGLMQAKSMNPVFLMDEIDKLSKDYHQDPASSLLEVLDPTQNAYFKDLYIEEEINLSQVFFIVTANDLENIPEPLKDRLEILSFPGYTEFDKVIMAKEYLLPRICKECGLKEDEITIEENALWFLITQYTKEAGVRQLEKQLSSIVRKIILESIMQKKEEKKTLTIRTIKKYLPEEKIKEPFMVARPGFVFALASYGSTGDLLPVETNISFGFGKMITTGSLGENIKESMQISLSYLKAHQKEFHLLKDNFFHKDFHLHIPFLSFKKDGPSAGIAITTAFLSYMKGLCVPTNIAFTGEMSLTGKILPIGSFKEKCMGVYQKHIDIIIYPKANEKEIETFPERLKKAFTFVPVEDYQDVVSYLWGGKIYE